VKETILISDAVVDLKKMGLDEGQVYLYVYKHIEHIVRVHLSLDFSLEMTLQLFPTSFSPAVKYFWLNNQKKVGKYARV
jgi:hypothetical protein